MTYAEQSINEDTHRISLSLRKFLSSVNVVSRSHINKVYEGEKFLHGQVPVNLDERLETGVRIVFLQVEGILNTPNLPKHFALRLIRNLVEMSLAEIKSKPNPTIVDLDRALVWGEIWSILDS